ncbi:MAG: hypothetical protein IKZ19_06835 [Clostridia bacterium]|nr:hypothetical protein [Clostridia bacterium]
MKNKTKAVAFCGILCALSVVIMLLGNILGLGTYASPMIAGLILLLISKKYGRKYHIIAFFAVCILNFIFVGSIEQNLMFVLLFGPYPIIRPIFQRLPKVPRMILKVLFFNSVTVGLEFLIVKFLAPEVLTKEMIISLLALGNLTFVLYDLVLARSDIITHRLLGRILDKF